MIALVAPASPLWFFARGAGFVSLVLLTISVCLGILVSMRARSRNWPLFLSDSLHGYTAVVFFVFVTLHVVTVLLDPFTKFGLTDVLVPFASTYRRVWLGLGVLALELAVAMGASVYLRRWISYRAWRVLHLGTYAVFPMALVHGLATGSDTRAWWGSVIYAVCVGAVLGASVARLWSGPARARGPLTAAAALGMFFLASWLTVGPMRAGWAREAGTPQLDMATASPAAGPGASPSPLALARPFIDRVNGRVTSQTAGDLKANGTATGAVDLTWTLDAKQDLNGTPSGTLEITTAGGTPICTATLTNATRQGIEATCAPGGAQGTLQFVLALRQRGGGPLGGTLSVSSGPPAPAPAPSASAPGTI
ncbi:MAG: hypothetical protein QOK05_904 [Chloroflexota bacterium]|nr:hypothetical protein [Chloroflexota bacterium]